MKSATSKETKAVLANPEISRRVMDIHDAIKRARCLGIPLPPNGDRTITIRGKDYIVGVIQDEC